jgi:hypothetical protein
MFSTDISLSLNIRVMPVLCNGLRCWTLKEQIGRSNTVEMHLLRAVLGCRIKDCVRITPLFHLVFVLVIILKLGGLKFVRTGGTKQENWEFRA